MICKERQSIDELYIYWLATVLCRKCSDELAQRNNFLIALLELNVI